MGVPEARGEAGAGAGEVDRTGGVPKRGGETPIELDSAAASAETPGPETCEPGPGSGVNWPDDVSSPDAAGVGLVMECEGTGEARRAVGPARSNDRPRYEPGDVDMGRCPGSGDSLAGFGMVVGCNVSLDYFMPPSGEDRVSARMVDS